MSDSVPQHIAFIMDGNRRWASEHNLPSVKGHEQGLETVQNLMDWLEEAGVQYCTVYAFSTENWKREVSEVKFLMKLLLKAFTVHLKEFHNRNVKLMVSGRIDELSNEIQIAIGKAMRLTKNNTKAVLNIAINYGGRGELVDAVKKLLANNIPPSKIDEAALQKYLYSNGELPDPDLVIRTGGEMRLSNFLPWQSVYSELYFTDTLWPDFSQKDLQAALREFAQRKRNFGK